MFGGGRNMEHVFLGSWITDSEFYKLSPRNVFHKQLDKVDLPCEEHRNRHILFRKTFCCDVVGESKIYITADDYYKLYINGQFVGQGPAPSYHFQYNYNVWDVQPYLQEGENTIAVHTLYQGLINRVWQSGDNRHGLILDLEVNGEVILSSDETFRTRPHSGFAELGTCGYQTQFLECCDSNAPEVGFERPDFDDSQWEYAKRHTCDDHTLRLQTSGTLVFEQILPVKTEKAAGRVVFDFGSIYVGYLSMAAQGHRGDVLTIRCAQELNEDGSLRYQLRASTLYEETWILTEGRSQLEWFDYKSFRYAEILLPQGVELEDVYFSARHLPFTLQTALKAEYADNEDLQRIWNLCVHSQEYGVQEVIQDCMEREKGFYLGDGCYTALANMILTKDDRMVRKLIDDAFASSFITDTLVTCMDCSFMQEIAEYPMIMVYLILWHYNLTGDKAYLEENYPKTVRLLEAFRREYEKDGLLRDVDKWCVVEWPKNFQHGYDVDIREGKVCHEAHVSLNAYYIEAVRVTNRIAEILGQPRYRDETVLFSAFRRAFYDEEKKLFRDGENTKHISLVGNSFVFGFSLYPDEECAENILRLLQEHGIQSLSFFCTFPMLLGCVQRGRYDLIREALLNDGTWKRMLREDATTTFEGWGRDTKWNTSLFHLTMSFASVFMADVDLKKCFAGM